MVEAQSLLQRQRVHHYLTCTTNVCVSRVLFYTSCNSQSDRQPPSRCIWEVRWLTLAFGIITALFRCFLQILLCL